MIKRFFAVSAHPLATDLGLLVVRLICGSAFIIHGWPKIQDPTGWAGPTNKLPAILLILAAISEFGGGIALITGLLSRLAAFGIACTMIVAVAMHALIMKQPFVSLTGGLSYELAATFLSMAVLILLAGPGRISVDRKIFGTR